MFEAGYTQQQQVSFQTIRQSEIDTGRYTAPDTDPTLRHAESSTTYYMENRFLDSIVSPDLHVVVTTEILGTKANERFTVKEVIKINDQIKRVTPRSRTISGDDTMNSLFQKHFAIDNTGGPAIYDNVEVNDAFLTDFFMDAYNNSKTFRAFFKHGVKTQLLDDVEWSFVFNKEDTIASLPSDRRRSSVDKLRKKIYVFDDDTYYISTEGFQKIQIERKLISKMLHVLTDIPDTPVNLGYTNRGPETYFTDKILKEMGYHFPRRVSAATVSGEQITNNTFRNEIDPRIYQTTARRALVLEDAYLKTKPKTQTSISSDDESGFSRDKRINPTFTDDLKTIVPGYDGT